MTDTPGPWRRFIGRHHRQCSDFYADVSRREPNVYRWYVQQLGKQAACETGAAPTLAAAKRAATAALIRHAPLPF